MNETRFDITSGNDRQRPSAALHVEVIADLVCPFCFVGKHRLDEALEAVQGPCDVSWYPYQLNPEIPAEGLPFDVYLTRRFSSPANVEPVLAHLAHQGRSAGIEFRFDRIRHVPNTLPVHQVMQAAEGQGLDQSALAEDLLRAFFEEGRNIGDHEVLVDIAGRRGLGPDEVRQAITSESLRLAVISREAQVRGSGLAGVPGYLLNRRLLVVGAQTADQFVNAFDRAMFGEDAVSLVSPAVH